MRPLIVKQLDYDLTPVAGLALVGHHLERLAPALARLDAAFPVRTGVTASDILRSYLGLLVQGKSDFDAIENFRGDTFFKRALNIKQLPSIPTLRQRLDARASDWFEPACTLIETLLASARPDYGLLPCGWLPLDVDTFAMDNSGTAKDGMGWAAPMLGSMATARWRRIWVPTGSAWSWPCDPACSTRLVRPRSTSSGSFRWPSA